MFGELEFVVVDTGVIWPLPLKLFGLLFMAVIPFLTEPVMNLDFGNFLPLIF